MKLAEDFSVRKVMSVREELWMTDGDWAKTRSLAVVDSGHLWAVVI